MVLVATIWVMETVQIHIGFRCCSAVEFWRLLPLVFTDTLMVIPYKAQRKHWFHIKMMWQEHNLLAAQAFWTSPQSLLHCDQGATTLWLILQVNHTEIKALNTCFSYDGFKYMHISIADFSIYVLVYELWKSNLKK